MYAIYGDIYHQYTPNVSIYAIHGSYGYDDLGVFANGGYPWIPKKSRDSTRRINESMINQRI